MDQKKPAKNLVSVILKVFVGSDGNWTIHKTDKWGRLWELFNAASLF